MSPKVIRTGLQLLGGVPWGEVSQKEPWRTAGQAEGLSEIACGAFKPHSSKTAGYPAILCSRLLCCSLDPLH